MQCTHGVTSVGGVTAGPARLNSSNVGLSLRARWETGQVGHISSMDNGDIPILLNCNQTTNCCFQCVLVDRRRCSSELL